MKLGASNAGNDLIETIMVELTKLKVIVKSHGLDSYYNSSKAKQLIDVTIIGPSTSKSNRIWNDKLAPQKQLSKSLSQSCPGVSVNQLSINTPLVETFSDHRRGINVPQIKEDFSIDKNIRTSLLGTALQIHLKNLCTITATHKKQFNKTILHKNF